MKEKIVPKSIPHPFKITLKLLKEWGACTNQRMLFKKTFPRGATLSYKTVEKAAEAGLNITFVLPYLLSKAQIKQYYIQERDHRRAWGAGRRGMTDLWARFESRLPSTFRKILRTELDAAQDELDNDFMCASGKIIVDLISGRK